MTEKQRAALQKKLAKLSPEEIAALTTNDHFSKRQAYEQRKNEIVENIIGVAKSLNEQLAEAKASFDTQMKFFETIAADYAGIEVKQDKINRTLTHSDGKMKVEYSTQENFSYGELATEAEGLIREWLNTMVTDDNKVIYEFVTSLMERKMNGKLDPRQINKLYSYEDRITDSRFKRALQLFKEAYRCDGSKSYIRVYVRETLQSPWEQLNLNFSNI